MHEISRSEALPFLVWIYFIVGKISKKRSRY